MYKKPISIVRVRTVQGVNDSSSDVLWQLCV